jgi:hypothetical protein
MLIIDFVDGIGRDPPRTDDIGKFGDDLVEGKHGKNN